MPWGGYPRPPASFRVPLGAENSGLPYLWLPATPGFVVFWPASGIARPRSFTFSERAMRLLCADDEPDIRAILRLALSLDPEMDVEVVDSGHAAIARAAAGAFDAIVLDGMMPGLDGYETCRILKSDPATAHVPILFLTAKTQRDEARRALSVGAVACLTKPFDPMTIGQELRAALLAARSA